jgi:hypothetical protein
VGRSQTAGCNTGEYHRLATKNYEVFGWKKSNEKSAVSEASSAAGSAIRDEIASRQRQLKYLN